MRAAAQAAKFAPFSHHAFAEHCFFWTNFIRRRQEAKMREKTFEKQLGVTREVRSNAVSRDG
jgi:hypothetical protein